MGSVLGSRDWPARDGFLPPHIWCVLDCGLGQCGVWFVGRMGIGALSVLWQKSGRCLGRFAICITHRSRWYFFNGIAGRQRLGGPIPRTDGHSTGLQRQRHCHCAHLHRLAFCGSHGTACVGGCRKRTGRSRHLFGRIALANIHARYFSFHCACLAHRFCHGFCACHWGIWLGHFHCRQYAHDL